jgi:long-chain acyl-CoA synthetase
MRLLGARMKSSSPLQQSVESLTKSTNNPVSSKASMPFVNSKDQKLTVSAVQNNPGSKLAFEFSNLVELVHKACDHYRNDNLFGTKVGNTFEWIKFGDFGREVQRFRNVLSHLKFGYNDKIALISNNRVEWAVAACAAQSLGGQIVPMYEAQLDKDWRYIVEDSGASIVLVSTEKIYEKTSSYVGQVGQVRTVLCMDASAEYMHSYKRRMKTVETETAVDVFPVTSDDLCTIIYTSGTTGKPKGVLLTHGNIASNLKGMEQLWSGKLKKEVSLAFLPWAHVFGQTCEFYAAFREGNSMGIVNKEAILESLDIVKPTILISVPALFNKVYDGVMKKVSQGSPISKTIFKTAMSISRRRNKLLEFGKPVPFLLNLQFKFFDKIVFEKIRARFGGRLKFMASGGAAISLTVLEFFEDISIPVCTGYGLTETSPVVTSCNSDWSTRRLGTCGVLLSDVSVIFIDPNTLEEVPVGQDGEVCVAGPLVMRGYHNNPEASDEVFMMKNGKKYFKTGDLGHMEDGKFLKITGRIKEQFKLENGKYVVPIPVEDDMCRSLFIHQVCAFFH